MSDRLKTDILIVGSGPAGSTVAKYAAEKGVQVTFIERRPEVGVPVRCGEYLPDVSEIRTMFPKAEDLEGTFDLPEEMKLLRTETIRLVNPKGKATDIPAIEIDALRRMLDALKMMPPISIHRTLVHERCAML